MSNSDNKIHEPKTQNQFHLKQFVVVTLLTSIWIHIGEILRAVFVALPRIKDFFDDKAGIAELNLSTGIIWGLWDTLLTAVLVFVLWLCASAFGHSLKTNLLAGTVVCAATIGIFWIATVNSGLGEWTTAFIIFPLAWIELTIGAWIASKLYQSGSGYHQKN